MGEFIWGRYALWAYTGVATIIFCGLAVVSQPYFLLGTAISGGLFALGFHDFVQKKRGVLANYPLLGRARYILESIRPELRQYFWEADTDELPYSRNQRAMVYQRARGILAARPMGTVLDIYAEDFTLGLIILCSLLILRIKISGYGSVRARMPMIVLF